MSCERISIEAFLEAAQTAPVLDVRSPGEYAQGHIPGAHSFPLFTDEARKKIGTAYKQQSREAAIKIGLDAFGPDMRRMTEAAEVLSRQYATKKLLLHCWRGGMRSEAVAWLLSFYGFDVRLLESGYKAYRQWAIAHWDAPRDFRVIGGYTGSAKTFVLDALRQAGQPVLDLEGLALHQGSAFGNLERKPQPTQEQFENALAQALYQLSKDFPGRPVWVEDESQRIGDLNLPHLLWQYLLRQPMYFLDVPFEERLRHITAGYAHFPTESLINAIVRIKKRLGGSETKTAVSSLLEGDIKGCFRVLLFYYDKLYRKAFESRPQPGFGSIATIPLTRIDAAATAAQLIQINL